MILPSSATSDHTSVLQDAIDDPTNPEVVLGPGRWQSGPLRLRSGLTLRLAPGAILRALPEPTRYPHYTHPIASRMDAYPRRSFLFGCDLEDVTLSGEGLIDFSGDHPAFQDRVGDSPDRPYGLHLVACRRVRLENLRLRNSAYWMIRLLRCRDVRIRDLDVFNHANLNNDGLDIDSCEDVVVSGCHIDSSDDGIVLKSETPHPCRNIIVADCLVASHASAIKLGTASLGGFENVLVHHCIIRPSRATVVHHPFQYAGGMTGLDVVSVDGGLVRDVHFDHIVMEGVANPLFVRLGQRHSTLSVPKNRRREDAGAPLPPVTGAGRIERVSFTHIHAHDVGPMPSIIAGFENHPLRDLAFRDIQVRLAPGRTFDPDVSPDWNPEAYPCAHLVAGARGGLDAQGFVFRHIEGLALENIVVEAPPGDHRPTLSRHQA